MSLLIAEAELPEEGFKDFRVFHDGTVTSPRGGHVYGETRYAMDFSDDHGDLIDRDSFSRTLKSFIDDEENPAIRDRLLIILDFCLAAEPYVIIGKETEL